MMFYQMLVAEDATKHTMRLRLLCLLVFLVAILSMSAANGSDWKIVPRISLSELYTDNLDLSSTDETGRFITEVTPGVSAARHGARMQANIDYQLQSIFRGSDSELFQQLSSSGLAELHEDIFFLEADASVGQSVIDSRAPGGLDNINETDNRTNVVTANVSPFLMYKFGGSIDALAKYRYGIVNYLDADSEGDLGEDEDNRIRALNLSVSTLDDVTRKLTWRLGYDHTVFERKSSGDDTLRSSLATLGFRVSSRLQFLLDAGDDDNDLSGVNQVDTSGFFWNAGIRMGLGARNQINAGFGQRYGENAYNFMWAHRARHMRTNVSYTQTLDTQANVLSQEGVSAVASDMDEEPNAPDETAINEEATIYNQFGVSGDVFIRKLFSASSVIEWSKTGLRLGVQHERRLAANSLEEDVVATTLNSSVYWNYGARTRLVFDLLYEQMDQGGDYGTDDTVRTTLTLARRLGPRTNGDINYSYTDRDSDVPEDSYTENRIWVSLTRQF